jgi:hypothetical protein
MNPLSVVLLKPYSFQTSYKSKESGAKNNIVSLDGYAWLD